ncbi:MAG: lysylphosphatidylglycerol synthase transmembrane domain-containing protein [Bacteroidota bacterium]
MSGKPVCLDGTTRQPRPEDCKDEGNAKKQASERDKNMALQTGYKQDNYNSLSDTLKRKITKWIKLLLPLLIGAFLMWWIYKKFTPEQLEKIRFHFRHADYSYIYLSVLFGFLSHLSRAYRWNYLLQPLGYSAKFHNNVFAVGISYLMNVFIPRSGEVSRALAVKKYERIPFEKAFGTIVAERAVDTIILLAFVILAFSVQYTTLKDFMVHYIDPAKIIGILVILLVTFLAVIVYIRRSDSLLSRKIKVFITGFKEGVFAVLKLKKTGLFVAHTVFIWLMYLAMFYVTTFALQETAAISFSAVLTGFVVGAVAIALTNGGFEYYTIFIGEMGLVFDVR